MGHGGKREGAGRKPKIASAAAADGRTNAARIWATRLIAGLTDPGSLDPKLTPAEVIEIEEWRPLWEALDLRIRLDTRKYLRQARRQTGAAACWRRRRADSARALRFRAGRRSATWP